MRIVKPKLDTQQKWKYRSLFHGEKASAGFRLRLKGRTGAVAVRLILTQLASSSS
jgi:hypothetical protein